MRARCCLKRHKFRLFVPPSCESAHFSRWKQCARAQHADRNNLIRSMGLTANKAELPVLDNEIVSGNEEAAITPDVSHR